MIVALSAEPGAVAAVVSALNAAGNLPVWAVVIGIASIATGIVRGLRPAILVALTFASDLAGFGVKILVERDRPDTAAVEQFFGLDNFSYPSGHTVRAAALVATLVWLFAPARYRLPLAVSAAPLPARSWASPASRSASIGRPTRSAARSWVLPGSV